jgi:hypothetical protein
MYWPGNDPRDPGGGKEEPIEPDLLGRPSIGGRGGLNNPEELDIGCIGSDGGTELVRLNMAAMEPVRPTEYHTDKTGRQCL